MALDIDRYLHEELAADLLSERPTDRKHAMIVLARLGRGEETFDTLRYLAETDPDPALRELARATQDGAFDRLDPAIHEVRVTGDDPARLDLALLAQAFASESPLARLAALVAAARTHDARLLEPALTLLDRETDDWVIATLIKTAGHLGGPVHVPRIQRFLAHSSARVVANTVEAIATLDAEAGFALLVPLLSATDSRVQASAIGAMIATERKAALETLVAMSRSPRPQARESALHCLKRLAEPEAEGILTDMLLAETDGRLVGRIADVLAGKASRATLVRLCPVVAHDRARPFHAALQSVVASVQARLQVPADELEAMRRAPLVAPSKPAAVPPRAPAAPAAASRFWRPVALALALLWGGGWWAWSARSDAPRSISARDIAPTALAQIARSNAPGRYLNQVVRWEGVVEHVDARAGSVRLRSGQQVFSATLDAPPAGIKAGDRLSVTGRVVGRSRLGPVYLQGLRAEKI